MTEPPTRRTRRAVAPAPTQPPQQPTAGPFCSSCGYDYATTDPVDLIQLQMSTESSLLVECPGCSRKATPAIDRPAPKTQSALEALRPQIDPAVRKIVETIFRVDFAKESKRLHENLTVGEGRNDHATVALHLDHAPDNAVDAHRLWVNMKIEYERYKLDREPMMARMRENANDALQSEKDAGSRSKTITEADIKAKIAELYPDEYRDQELEKKRLELAVDNLEVFAKMWSEKGNDLRTILNRMRGG